MAKRRVKKGNLFLAVVILCILVGAGFGLYKGLTAKEEPKKEPKKEEEPIVEVKKLQIINEDSKSRNIAVMYNNISTVWGHQAGLQDAYIVYEMLVEGGYTRLMGIFRDVETAKMGSVRSARPYYLDYVLENDAIYINFGGSEQAKSDIKKLALNNIDGMSNSVAFWREKGLNLAYEHTAYTSIDRIKTASEKAKFKMTSEQPLLLQYNVEEIAISTKKDAKPANKIFIEFSKSHGTTFEYDPVTQVYLRSQNNSTKKVVAHKDTVTGEQYSAKNIIIYDVPCNPTDVKGRQELENIGGGKGWLVTGGYAVPISWEKRSRAAQTVYRYLDGTRIELNDGITYIEIQPTGRTLTIE